MVSLRALEILKALPGVTEKDHFGGEAFYANKRMFATVWRAAKKANLRFSPEQQKQFLASDGDAFSEIQNAWGKQGWTHVHLEFIQQKDFLAAANAAHDFSAVKNVKKASSKPKKKTARKVKKNERDFHP